MAKTVILDTDIGSDIDDTWALGQLLNTPELAPAMILSCSGDTFYRASLCCKFLEKCGRSDVPVGAGIPSVLTNGVERQRGWLAGYQAADYPGEFYKDGVAKAIEILENNDDVTIIAIGPMTNLAEICSRRPELVSKCNLVAMAGSIFKQHDNKDGAIAEYNVQQDIPAAQTVWRANWKNITITPLDTCGMIFIVGDHYRKIFSSKLPIPEMIMENYKDWTLCDEPDSVEFLTKSSKLYDTVAVHLAYTHEFLEMQTMNLRIDDEGFMRISDCGRPVDVALRWKDEEAFYRKLTACLLAE